MPISHDQGPIIVGIGEALFDCFPDEERLGGAPCNFAFHANQLVEAIGGRGIAVSRVGCDERGDRLQHLLSTHGLTTDYIQRDENLPTGTVRVILDAAGDASYRFDDECAWDALALDPSLVNLAESIDAVCFGTLSRRHATSAMTILGFLRHAHGSLKVFDANLRQSFYTEALLAESLKIADMAKLNEEELGVVASLVNTRAGSGASDEETAQAIRSAYALEHLVVTRGAAGISTFSDTGRVDVPAAAFHPEPGADSVGAGDACTAALTAAIVAGCTIEEAADLASEAGAYVAGQSGATPRLPKSLRLRLQSVSNTSNKPQTTTTP